VSVIAPARVFSREEALDALGAWPEAGPWRETIIAALGAAPYLARLAKRRPDLIARLLSAGPDALAADALKDARAAAALPFEEAMAALRGAKAAMHLACAVGDLAGAWPLAKVTGALTDLADAACVAAVELSGRTLIERGELAAASEAARALPGFIAVAMGKQGARELNYSSDIDVTLFFDPALFPAAPEREPKVIAQRMAPLVARVLEETTADGYVFRTDFRLRPDPASTPIVVSTLAAETYYQSVGQNWERAALIKARACAGDLAAGEAFLESIEPFIWRRHLDYAAIADIHSIKRQIRAIRGGDLQDEAPDVKLGRGGIRDIELFVQTQQLILGGRDKRLRVRDTLGALEWLAKVGVIDSYARDDLAAAYVFLRGVEHRIQMLHDEQTHRVPADPDLRARLAALCGMDDAAALDVALAGHRQRVAEIDAYLFRDQETLADPLGSLSFTGVESDPETLKTLAGLGFQNPERVAEAVRGWHHGRLRATRTERAREILTALMPRLLRAMAESGEPDTAFIRFDDFLKGLPAGVQVLSLLAAQPALLNAIADAFGLAPRVSTAFARRPALIDALLEPRFVQPLADDQPGEREAALRERMKDAGFEDALNFARRFHAEETLRIGLQVLERRASAVEAGRAYADLAQACVRALASAALDETMRRLGPEPGAFVILALGKFGGEELAEGSDLDLMLIYDAPEGAVVGDLTAGEYYARLVQRLISALSAPTEEGLLYEVDMQLRPSGSKGPVAVRHSSFERYYREEAWTWELQAMTRARPVAGDEALARRAMDSAHQALSLPRDPEKLKADVADMRARMDRERPAYGLWDLKLARGGLVDIEFIAQGLMLAAAAGGGPGVWANTGAALQAISGVSAEDRATLTNAWRLYSDLMQVLRICVDEPFAPEAASGRLRILLAQTAGERDFADLETRLARAQADVRSRFQRLLGRIDDGSRRAAR
jgi:glutamate-ammonia-ligase adenylyltransferase